MALHIEEVLSLWREGERLLDELPVDAPERELVSAELLTLKETYKRLTEETDVSAHMIGSARETLDSAKAVLELAKTMLQQQPAADSP